MIKEAKDRVRNVTKNPIAVGGLAFLAALSMFVPAVGARAGEVQAAVDKDFKETGGVDLQLNPDTNVYTAIPRRSSYKAGSQRGLIVGILQKVARESGCDIFSITHVPARSADSGDKEFFLIPVNCPSRNR